MSTTLTLQQLIHNALADDPDYPPGTDLEFDFDAVPLLESHPNQSEIKIRLLATQDLEFLPDYNLYGLRVMRLGNRHSLYRCCDYECDRVIVRPAIMLFVSEGEGGVLAFHTACFSRLIENGNISLSSGRSVDAGG